jgi:class 3 adenylate cyclase
MSAMRARGAVPSRATATVLFTDLVGSTELRSRLGGEAAEALRRRHDRLLADIVQANQGWVVKGLGDGIMATFPGASDAVAAAVGIQRAVHRYNRSAKGPPAPLELRVGVSAGDVVFEEADCFGTPVVEAARLCAACSGGRILASEVVRSLVGASGYGFRPVGALDLKGLPEPVPAVEVDWTPESRSVPLPAPLERPGLHRFVGRHPEQHVLSRAWKEAATGEPRLVLVAGEPGIGKTRLVSELSAILHGEGATVLYGRCHEDLGIPYQPFAEALRTYVLACPGHELRIQLGPLGGELVRLVPGLADRIPGLPEPLRGEPDTERYRLLEAVREFVAGISDTAPVLFVLDDLHWAAKATLVMLLHLVRSVEGARLLVVGTYRDTEVDRGHPLTAVLADLRRETGVERLALGGLHEDEVVDLVEAVAGHALDDEGVAFARAVHAETEGNPFFVGEVVRHMVETGAVAEAAGGWKVAGPVSALGISEGVREVVGRRLSRLPPDSDEVLAAAAVVGREFDASLLVEVTGAGQEAVLDAIGQAEQARLLLAGSGRPGDFSFAHSLVRSTLYDRLPRAHRLRLHLRVGRALEQRPDAGARVIELAYHFGEAAPLGEADRAVTYARQAGDRARASLAFEEAAAYYERALAALGLARETDPATRCDLQIDLGDALHRAGDEHHRDVLLAAAEAARTLGDGRRLAHVVLALNLMGFSSAMGKVDEEVVSLTEEALAQLRDDDALRARLLAVLAVELAFTPDRNRRWSLSREAVAVARRSGDRQALARVLAGHTWGTRGPDNLDERLATATELIALGESLGDREATFWGHLMRAWDLLEVGEVDRAEADTETAGRLAEELRQPIALWRAGLRRNCHVLLAGRLEEAERLALENRETAVRGGLDQSLANAIFGGVLFTVRWERGRLAEMENPISALVSAQPGLPLWRVCLAFLYCETDRLVLARPHFDMLAAGGFADLPLDITWLNGMVVLAMVAAALGDENRGAVLYQSLLPYSGRNACNGPACMGPVDRALGLLATLAGRFGEADGHFAASAELARRMRAPTFLARTQLEWARMLGRRAGRGDAERARELATAALTAAEELGMSRVAEQARFSLRTVLGQAEPR